MVLHVKYNIDDNKTMEGSLVKSKRYNCVKPIYS